MPRSDPSNKDGSVTLVSIDMAPTRVLRASTRHDRQALSVARGRSIDGPYEGDPSNPVLSARSTNRPVQSTGHADLVTAPDGTDVLVLLGVRPTVPYPAYSPLGRETFVTPVAWVDGWPRPAPVTLSPRPGTEEQRWDFADPAVLGARGGMGLAADC